MTDGEVVSGEEARPGRVRAFLARRSLTQRLGALAVLAVLATAPFGGWRSTTDADVKHLELRHRLDTGPYYVTIERVRQVAELPPVLERDPSVRYFALNLKVTNHTDRAEQAGLLMDMIGGEHSGITSFPDQFDTSSPEVRLYNVDDAVQVDRSEFINPGLTYSLAFVIAQSPDTDLDEMTVSLLGFHFQEDDPGTLDPNRWVADPGLLAEGHLPVEVTP